MEAEDAAAEAVKLDPLNTKAHFRRAKALFQLGRHEESACSIACSVALLPRPLDAAVTELYASIRSAYQKEEGAAAIPGRHDRSDARPRLALQLPSDSSRVEAVRSSAELMSRLSRRDESVKALVLLPGCYCLLPPPGNCVSIALLGVSLSAVSCAPSTGAHALFVDTSWGGSTSLFVSGVTFKSSKGYARNSAVCVSGPGSTLRLVGCEFLGYPEVGVLLCGKALGEVHRCTFRDLGKQALEVREGASLLLTSTSILSCKKGVCAYGGARRVDIHGCRVANCSMEGMVLAGSFVNQATSAQKSATDRAAQTLSHQTSIDAEDWGRRNQALLEVTVTDSEIAGNGMFGISADTGACVQLTGNRMEGNDPVALLIKGSTSVFAGANRISYGNGRYRGMRHPDGGHMMWGGMEVGGIWVGVNYSGNVVVRRNCFISQSPKRDIVEERLQLRNDNMAGRALGWWSKPVSQAMNLHFTNAHDGPGISQLLELMQRDTVPPSLPNPHAAPVDDEGVVLPGMMATHRTFLGRFDESTHYYAVGNVKGFDLSAGQLVQPTESEAEPSAEILFLACGDIRNVLKTAYGMFERQPSLQLVCTLNDISAAILARAVLLLSLISSGTSAGDLLAVWCSFSLTAAQKQALDGALAPLAAGEWPPWLGTASASESTLQSLKEAFSCWLHCGELPGGLHALRDTEQAWATTPELQHSAVELTLQALGSKQHHQEVHNYISSGNLTREDGQCHPNPTLLDAPSLQFNLYWSSSIYRAIDLGPGGARSSNLFQQLTRVAEQHAERVREALHQGRVTFNLLLGDAVEALLLTSGAGPPTRYDFIDCSNVGDYVSMPAILQAAVGVLKREPHARIHMQSLHSKMFEETGNPLRDFVQPGWGMDLDTVQELLGVRLNRHRLEAAGKQLHLMWGWKEKDEHPGTWLTAQYLFLELLASASRQCAVDRAPAASRYGQAGGLDCSCSTTLSHLLHICCRSGTARPLAALLSQGSKAAKLFKWELQGQAQYHDPASNKKFLRCSAHMKVDYLQTCMHSGAPLALAFTKVPVVAGTTVDGKQVKQMLESFSFDQESGVVRFMFQREIFRKMAGELYVCLIAVTSEVKMLALSSSYAMSSISTASMPRTPKWCEPQSLQLQHNLDFDLGGSFLQRHPSEWQAKTHAHAPFVTQDLVLPESIPTGWKPSVQVRGDSVAVEIVMSTAAAPSSKKKSQQKKLLGSHVVTLPDGAGRVSNKSNKSSNAVVKHSEALGLVSIRLSTAPSSRPTA